MPQSVIYDTCLLSHIAEIKYLHVLDFLYADRPKPRWPPAVKREVMRGAKLHDFCQQILELEWLGEPQEPRDTKAVLRLRSQLSEQDDPQTANLGEAESIILATEVDGYFMTNDFAAYRQAGAIRYLGTNRVLTACDALKEANDYGQITLVDVEHAHRQIRLNRTMICNCQFK